MTKQTSGREGRAIEDPEKELVALIKGMAPRWGFRDVFTDFIELSCLSISNAVDKAQFETREARYLEIAKKYSREDIERFPRMLGCLTLAMEQRGAGGELQDVLGGLYMALELGNDRAGQVFTPYPVSQLMARMLAGDARTVQAEVQSKGFLDLLEPTCGAGGMVIAMADALREAGLNYQRDLHATCVDIDLRCVHMTYLQLALLHVPAVVIHGNSLSLEIWSRWHTPAHVLGGWRRRLERRYAIEEEPGLMAQTAAGAGVDQPSPQAREGHEGAPPADAASGRAQATPQSSRASAQMLLFGAGDSPEAPHTPPSGVEHPRRRGKLGQVGESTRHTDETPPSS